MLRPAREFGGVTERNSDVTSEFELPDSGVEEADPPLGPVQQHKLDVGSPECHDQSRHSPTAAEIAPALAGHRLGHSLVSTRMRDMRQEVARAQKPLTLAAAEHGEQTVIRCRHDASHRILTDACVGEPSCGRPYCVPLLFAALTGRSGHGFASRLSLRPVSRETSPGADLARTDNGVR